MKLKKIILISLAVLVVFGLGGLLIGRQILVGYLTPEFLTEKIESQWNCRAKIESVDASLLGTSKVTVKGLALYPDDDSELNPANALIVAETVDLEISTGDLIRRRLKIHHLELSDVKLRSTVSKEGESSLAAIFESTKDTSKAETGEVTSDVVVVTSPDLSGNGNGEKGDFAAEDLPLALMADRVEVKNGSIEFLLESSGATVFIDQFQVAFTEIDVNPRLLDSHNNSKFQFGGDLKVIAEDKSDLVTAHIGGVGNMRPFDAATQEIDPAWAVNLTLSKGAKLNTFPILEKLHAMLGEIDTAGIDLGNLALRGELMADATTEIHQVKGKYLVRQPLKIYLPDTILEVDRDSWIDSLTNQHKMEGAVTLSEKNSARS